MIIVKALIFSQSGVGTHCLSGTEKALEKYGIGYSLATKIDSNTLQGYNVLFLPGGNSAGSLYINNSNINVSAIKEWQKQGGVVIATCSGAYASVKSVDGKYQGYGLAPNVNAKPYTHEGLLQVTLSNKGAIVLGRTGTLSMDHENGPAFYIPGGGSAEILATFSGGDFKGYPAIVVDGRTGLISTHPELTPFYPDLIYNLMNYILKKDGDVTMDFSLSNIYAVGDNVKNFIETNKRLPNFVTINNQKLNMGEFLNLAVTTIMNVNAGSKSNIPYKTVLDADGPNGTYTATTMSKQDYITMAMNVKNFITANGKAPNYATVSFGKIPTNDLINSFSKVLSFIKANNRLPNTLTVKQITTSTPTTTKGPIQLALEDAFGESFKDIHGFYDLVLRFGQYSYYYDSKYTLRQSIARIKLQRQSAKATGFKKVFYKLRELKHTIKNRLTTFTTSTYGLNCCNWAEVVTALAREMKRTAVIYGIYCDGDGVWHAVALINGEWVDCAAAAEDGYGYGTHWCNGRSQKEPSWCPYQSW